MRLPSLVFLMFCLLSALSYAQDKRNLLLNPEFGFHAYVNHREGKAISHSAEYVAFWNCDSGSDLLVTRSSHVPPQLRPPVYFQNGVKLKPGRRIYQFFTLPEAELIPDDLISLKFYAGKGMQAKIKLMKFDSEDGTWSPAEFGQTDKRSFPKHSRGELICAYDAETVLEAEDNGIQTGRIEAFRVKADFSDKNQSDSNAVFAAGIIVEFHNAAENETWLFAPSLTKSAQALDAEGALRRSPDYYRHIPRCMQKLWKGEAIHILLMGSSIDRASANPPFYVYDEDPKSPGFKQPLQHIDRSNFSSSLVGRADLEEHFAWANHYYSYAGRLKRELMRMFNLKPEKILLNFMAADGSCIGESHSALQDYCELKLPPTPSLNGHKSGKTWQELYPELFSRSSGPRPDLVIYGSGANEKTDTPQEAAVFEGAIRYMQRNYPDLEFLFCMFQNAGGYTANAGDLQAVALRYQIPYIDYGFISDLLNTNSNRYAQVPADGHPQAAAHYIWFKQIEKAFQCADPIQSGVAQLQLPERMHDNSFGWEGEMRSYGKDSPRIFKENTFIIDDCAFNCWAGFEGENSTVLGNGLELGKPRRSTPAVNLRNSLFRHGNLKLGDRHIIEIKAENAKVTAFDAKTCPTRQFHCVSSELWKCEPKNLQPHNSVSGYPYGKQVLLLEEGQEAGLEAPGSDFSLVWVDAPEGGILQVFLDEMPLENINTDQPFIFADGSSGYLENRKGLPTQPYGMHRLRCRAEQGSVLLMGLYTYDRRSNRGGERLLRGLAAANSSLRFHPPFKATPLANTRAKIKHIDRYQVEFAEQGGYYEFIGE